MQGGGRTNTHGDSKVADVPGVAMLPSLVALRQCLQWQQVVLNWMVHFHLWCLRQGNSACAFYRPGYRWASNLGLYMWDFEGVPQTYAYDNPAPKEEGRPGRTVTDWRRRSLTLVFEELVDLGVPTNLSRSVGPATHGVPRGDCDFCNDLALCGGR